jgi:hypothetical protein
VTIVFSCGVASGVDLLLFSGFAHGAPSTGQPCSLLLSFSLHYRSWATDYGWVSTQNPKLAS